jgi:actin-related protein
MSAAAAAAEVAGAEEEGGSLLLLSQPVVIDNGTATIKAGFAGSSKPKVTLRLCVNMTMRRRPKDMRFTPIVAKCSENFDEQKGPRRFRDFC